MTQFGETRLDKLHRWCLVGALVLVAVVGSLFTGRSWQQAETWMYEDLLDQAQLVARSVPLDEFKTLAGTAEDMDLPAYQRLKSQFAAVKLLDERWQWLYLMGRRPDGTVFFYVDSEDDSEADPSPPGQAYPEATPLLHRIFDTGEPKVEGPATDRWGTWLSPLVPIRDPQTGEVLAVFGIDIAAGQWHREVLLAGFPALLASLVLLVLLLLMLVFYQTLGSRVAHLRRIEVGLVVAVGLVLTLSVVWRSQRQERRYRQEQFSRLATMFSARALELFHDLRDGEISGLASLFRSSDWVSAEVFAEYTAHLRRNPAVRSWSWVPELPGGERSRFEEEMRAGGQAGYELWERDGAAWRSAAARELHYPVAYYSSSGDERGIPGLDLASDPCWLEAITEARRTGLVTAAKSPLGADHAHPGEAISILAPVWLVPDGAARRQRGFVQATLDTEGIMRVVANSMPATEEGPVAFVELLELNPDQAAVRLAAAGSVPGRRSGSPLHVQPVFAFGRTYALRFCPGPGFQAAKRGPVVLLAVSFGGVVTMIVGMLVALLGHHRAFLEEVVARRTADLQASVRRFNQLGIHGQTYVWETDGAGLFTYLSQNVSAILGYQPGELVGRLHYYDLHPEAGREEFKAATQAVFARLDSFRALENRIRTKDGRMIWVATDGLPILGADGRLLGYRGSDRDITEQWLAREKERFRRRFNELLARVAADFVVASDAEFDRVVEQALARLGELYAADRCYLFQNSAEAGCLDNTHEWCAPGISAQKERNQHMCPADLPWLSKQVLLGRPVQTAELDALPEEHAAEREYLRSQEVQSLLCVPLRDKRGGLVGFLGLDMVRGMRDWSGEEVAMLEVVAGMVAGAIDRNQTQRALAASENALRLASARLDFILEATRTNIDIIDRDYNLRHVDRRWQQVYGDPAGRKCHEYFMGLAEPCEGCTVRHAIDTRQILVSEQVLSREGNRVVEVHSIPFQEADGEWLAAEFNIDITERKRAENALQETLERYRLLADYTDDFVSMNTAAGVRLYVSPSYYRKTGWSEEEIRSGDWRQRVHPDDLEMVERLHAANLAGEATRGEYRIRCRDGSWLWVDSRCKPIPGGDGRTERMLVWSHDITARKQAESDREKLQEQLAQAQKMESVGRLAGGVAHDFNNMLQAILGYTELALDQVAPGSPLAADLSEVRKVGERAAELTRQLLAFARKQTVSPRLLDLNNEVGEMLGMLRRLLGEHVGLSWMPGPALWTVRVDPVQIGMVLTNLCLNARDAIAGQGRITIETRNATIDRDGGGSHAEAVPGDYVMLVVSDDGHGMDQETLAKVFEPFFTTKEMGKGTGLGLPMIHGIAMQNGGFVNVSSEPGKGSTFRFYLPRHREQEIPAAAGRRGPAQPLPAGRETILVAEDEPNILAVCREVLGRLGYTVLLADTPARAVELAEHHAEPLHLLLTDVVMPEMDGRQLAERIGQLHPGISCVYMSGYTADAIAHHGMLDAGIEFLQKPFTNQVLAETVRRVLDGKKNEERE